MFFLQCHPQNLEPEMKKTSKGKSKYQVTVSWLLTYLGALIGPGPFPDTRNKWEEVVPGVSVLGILTWIVITNWQ